MRELTEFPTEKEAQALADRLEVAGIEADVRQEGNYVVWILDDDSLEKAEELLRDYQPDAAHAAAAEKIRRKRQEDAKPKVVPGQQPTAKAAAGSATMLMIGISVVVAFASGLGDTSTQIIRALLVVPTFEEAGSIMAPVDLVWSEPWRLLTPMFIHFGVLHLAFNMMWLYTFGNQIESIHGTPTFLILVALSMIPGSVAQFELTGPLFGGMSGVNYGLFGFVWMQSKYTRRGYNIENRETVILMGWLLLCTTGFVGPVANACHAIGLAVGLAAGAPAYLRFRRDHDVKVVFEKGSWADLNLTGWQRFERQYVQPYIPIWFMAVALFVLLLDL